MKRRNFMQILGAFGILPTMPTLAITPTPIVNASYNHHMYGHALAMVRSRGSVSLLEFQKAMNLTLPQAQAMSMEFAREGMIANGFSTTGILNAIKPTWSNWGASGLQAPMQSVFETAKSKRTIHIDLDILENEEAEPIETA